MHLKAERKFVAEIFTFFFLFLDVTLCEEAVYQSLSSLRLSSVPLERLLESLPGRKVDRKSLERLKKTCSPQQQVLQLLRLWRERNKDQDKLYGIIQGMVATPFPDLLLCLNLYLTSVPFQGCTTARGKCPAVTA